VVERLALRLSMYSTPPPVASHYADEDRMNPKKEGGRLSFDGLADVYDILQALCRRCISGAGKCHNSIRIGVRRPTLVSAAQASASSSLWG
jgi:hypothetical protein